MGLVQTRRYRAQDECVGVQFRHYGNLPMETGETALNDCRRWGLEATGRSVTASRAACSHQTYQCANSTADFQRNFSRNTLHMILDISGMERWVSHESVLTV